jgi:hypothetical protein
MSPESAPSATQAAKRSARRLLGMLPMLLGVLWLSSLLVQLLPRLTSNGLLGRDPLLDALIGAAAGSVAAGQPVISYLLGGQLRGVGVDLVGVTALVIAWVTVGVAHIPLEASFLGIRFAVLRNAVAFVLAIVTAFLIAGVVHAFG